MTDQRPVLTPALARRRERRQALAREHAARVELVGSHAGDALRQAVKTNWKTATFTTWAEAVAALAAGVTVDVSCGDSHRSRAIHKVSFNADGTVDLLDHPGHVVDRDGELLLAGLGARMPACVAAAVYLPAGLPVPKSVTLAHSFLNRAARTLYAAVAWASQRPAEAWSASFGDHYLRFGITPALLDRWVQAGWEEPAAVRFLQQFAPLEVAEQWRTIGQVTVRAAKLAAAGEVPTDEDRWARAGFSPSRSARWRLTTCTPEEAYEYDQHRIPPTMVAALQRADTAGQVALEVTKAWCAAGVPATAVLGWYRSTAGDLSEALAWKFLRDAWHYQPFQEWNLANPSRVLDPSTVREWNKVGFPTSAPELVRYAVDSGVSPDAYAALAAALTDPEHPVRVAMRQMHAETQHDWHWYGFTSAALEPWALKSLSKGRVPTVSRHLVDWLASPAAAGSARRR